MRILAIYRHYWPDTTPYARILREILAHLAETGHELTVFTAQPGYNDVCTAKRPWRERIDGVDVRRVWLPPERKRLAWMRAVNFAYFLLRAVLHAVTIRRRYDLVIANSHPPILMGVALRAIRKLTGTPYIYHCQDIHPESARLAGSLREGWVYRQLRRMDASTCRIAQTVIVLSRDMEEAIAARGGTTGNLTVINNPPLGLESVSEAGDDNMARMHVTDGEGTSPGREEDSPVQFLFAGNLGRFQGLERLVEAAHLAAGTVPFQLTFLGEGAAKQRLIERAGSLLNRQVLFLPHQPVEMAYAAMLAADYGIVSLLPEVYRYAFPSKSMMYLSAGCPLLAIVEPQSELARTIHERGLGCVSPGPSASEIAAMLTTAAADRGQWSAERRRALQATCDALYGRTRMLQAWDELVPPVRRGPRSRGKDPVVVAREDAA